MTKEEKCSAERTEIQPKMLPDKDQKISEFVFFKEVEYQSLEMEVLTRLAAARLPDDPFFSEGDAICNVFSKKSIFDIDEEELCHKSVPEFVCTVPSCKKEFTSVIEYEMHYNSWHRYSCSSCNKQLPSPHLLDLHVAETHDSYFAVAAERKPMYVCYVESCTEKFKTPGERKKHCIEVHKFPHDFKFEPRDSKKKNQKSSKKKKQDKNDKESKMDVSPPRQNVKPKQFSFGIKIPRAFQPPKETKIDVSDLMEALPIDEGDMDQSNS